MATTAPSSTRTAPRALSSSSSAEVPLWSPLPEGAVYRISTRESPPSPARRAAPLRQPLHESRAPRFRFRWRQTGTAAVVMGTLLATLTMASWQLHQERTQTTTLSRELAGLKNTTSGLTTDLSKTRQDLKASEDDRAMMIDALRGTIRTQVDLRQNLAVTQARHAEEVVSKAKAMDAWTAYGDRMVDTVNQTNALRQEENEQAAQQVASLEDKTTKLNEVNQSLSQTAAELENSARSLANDNRALHGDLEQARSCLSTLESQKRNLESSNSQLINDVGSLQSCISGLRSTICSLESRIHCLESRIHCLESELSQAKSKQGR